MRRGAGRGGGGEAGLVRRGVALLVVVGVLVLAAVVDEAFPPEGGEASFRAGRAATVSRLTVPPPRTLSAAWYCAEGTSDPGGRADQTVVVANAGDRPVQAVVTVLLGSRPPVQRLVEVSARSRVQVRVAELVQTPDPGVVVEVFGGETAVEHVLTGAGDLAAGPCARHPATRWLFAGGTTVRDARDVLALFNPFEEDAVVDMTFFTEDGLERPAALQGFVVPARSRVTVPVHEHVLRKRQVAAEVRARVGRIVAERSIRWTGETGRRGLAVTLGVNAPAGTWSFPEGLVRGEVSERLWIFNPGRRETEVQVLVRPDGGKPVEPAVLAVPARAAVSFRVGDVLAEPGGHAVTVTATGVEDVVVQQEVLAREGAARPGYSAPTGIPEPASRWLFPAGSADDRFDEWLVVRNQQPEEAVVRVSVLARGFLLVPEGLDGVRIAPGSRVGLRLGDALKRSDLPLLVEADRPVEAVRGLFGAQEGVSLSPGIPFFP